jgi:aryl-alcohol dehydrogenase-like predicted oxidoreductase
MDRATTGSTLQSHLHAVAAKSLLSVDRHGRHLRQWLLRAALAWLLHQGPDIVPIPGTRRQRNLELNAAAADISLSAEELAHINGVFAPQAVAGERASAAYLERVNR